MKKILVGIGTISLASLPIIAVISCGKNDEEDINATLTINFMIDANSDNLLKNWNS